MNKQIALTCPIPINNYPKVLLAHGGGGKLMHQLIDDMFTSVFGKHDPLKQHDSAVFNAEQNRIAFTTDSYIVHPLFFPGGDIGKLALHGTVNDLSMAGAKPAYISVGFILEEGLAMEALWSIVKSMKEAADESGVSIVTGDTKVVDRGKGDGIYINTSGVGFINHDLEISPGSINKGDVIIVNGDIARHGMAIMAEREGVSFESSIESDTASLVKIVQSLFDAGVKVHCLRDLTRGGLGSTLNEIAGATNMDISINEENIPVHEDVAAACEIFGIDPIYVANEGRFITFVAEKDAANVLEVLRKDPLGKDAVIIGEVLHSDNGIVSLKTRMGVERIIDMLTGEQLPRIC